MLYASFIYENGKVHSIAWEDGELTNTVCPIALNLTREEFMTLVRIFSRGEGTKAIVQEFN